jgi:hypothetical protein
MFSIHLILPGRMESEIELIERKDHKINYFFFILRIRVGKRELNSMYIWTDSEKVSKV